MQWNSYRVHAHDELRLGSGRRTVLARVGRKWVRVKSRVAEGWAQRIHINTWNRIVLQEIKD